jgi:ribosome recycling factor
VHKTPCIRIHYRKELCKEAKSLGEEGKVAVRNIRRDSVDAIKKAEKVSYVNVLLKITVV